MKKVEEVWRRFAAFSHHGTTAKIGQQVLLTAASKALARGLNSGHDDTTPYVCPSNIYLGHGCLNITKGPNKLLLLDADRRPWRSYLGPECWLAAGLDSRQNLASLTFLPYPALPCPADTRPARLSSQASQASAC